MTTLWLLLITLAGFVVFAAVGDLVSEEVRGRLDALPHAALRLAVRQLPDHLRAERLIEWEGELHEILRGAEAFPVTRLWRGLRYAAGIVRAAPSIARALSVEDRKKSGRGSARKWVLSGVQSTRDTTAVFLASLFVEILTQVTLLPILEGWEITFNGFVFVITLLILFIVLLIFVYAAKKTVARVAAQVASCAVAIAFLDVAVTSFIGLGLSARWLTFMAIWVGFTFAGGLSVAWTAHRIRNAVCARRLRVNSATESGSESMI